MDKMIVSPQSIRGGGDILPKHAQGDFFICKCVLYGNDEVVDGVERRLFRLESIIDGGTGAALKALLSGLGVTQLIKNLTYTSGVISYSTVYVEDITALTDLEGVIYNLAYVNGVISFNQFTNTSSLTALTEEVMEALYSATMTLTYTNGIIAYTSVEDLT